MTTNIVQNLDIFFSTITALLYIAYIFFAKKLNSKFIVFFILSFISIFNYSTIIKNEYNFLTMVFLNIISILIVCFLYMYISFKKDNLSVQFVKDSNSRNATIIGSFIFTFLFVSFIFISFCFKSDLLLNRRLNSIMPYETIRAKKEGLIQKKELIKIDNKDYVLYTRNLSYIEDNKSFYNYNLVIMLYITFVILSFFLSTTTINIKYER